MFWNPEVITTTGKSLRITQITFNIIYIMRTNINQGRIQSLAVMIVLLINNDQNPISYLIPYSRSSPVPNTPTCSNWALVDDVFKFQRLSVEILTIPLPEAFPPINP